MKPLVVLHKGCPDGAGAGYAFWKKFGNEIEYRFQHYADEMDFEYQDRDIFVADFSFKRDQTQKLLDANARIVMLDHHATAFQELEGLEHPNLDKSRMTMEKSGAVIAWEYLFSDTPVPDLLLHIQDRDLWKFELNRTKEISLGLSLEGLDFRKWDSLNISDLYQVGRVILKDHQKKVSSIIRNCKREVVIEGHKGILVNAPNYMASDIGEALKDEALFVAIYADAVDSRRFHLRSRAFDVSVLAAAFGGGGHPLAAGFSVDRNHPLSGI